MRLSAVVACVFGAMLVSGCSLFRTTQEQPEDPDVAVRCTPVRSLLSKNVRSSANVTVPFLFNLGGLYDRTGAVLDPTEVARVVRIDNACRAWVKGGMSPQDYGKVLLESTAATIVQTTNQEDRPGVVEAVVKYFDELKAKGNLPSDFTSSSVSSQVASDSRLTQQELEAKLRITVAEIEAKFEHVDSGADLRQVQLVSRLDSIDRKLTKLEQLGIARSSSTGESASVSPTPSPAVTTEESSESKSGQVLGKAEHPTNRDPHGLDVYFATGSSELSFSERRRLEAASAAWVKADATIFVMGFSDPRGTEADNLRLSGERAHVVADVLRSWRVRVGAVSGGGVGLGRDYDELRRVQLRRVDSQRGTH